MSRPIAIARVVRLGHDAVEIERMTGDRVRAGEYDGIMGSSHATHDGPECSFRVRLPVGMRRPVACQILVSPVDVTLIPRPTEMDALGFLTRSLYVVSVNNHSYWSAALTVNRRNDTVTYAGSALSPGVAVANAIEEAIRHKAEWFDADPLHCDCDDPPILETPSLDPFPLPGGVVP